MKQPLTLGIIGCGRMGTLQGHLIRKLFPNMQIKWTADLLKDRAKSLAQELCIPCFTTNAHKIFQDTEVNTVLICTPTNTHGELCVLAAKAGKDIYCEKPLEVSLEKMKEISMAVQKAGVRFATGFNRRFDSDITAMQEVRLQKNYGKPELLKITSHDVDPPTAEYIKDSGTIFQDMTIHDFDLARFLMQSNVEEIAVMGSCLLYPELPKNPKHTDSVLISLRYENGALGIIDNLRHSPYHADFSTELYFERGKITMENLPQNHIICSDTLGIHHAKNRYSWMERWENSYAHSIRQILMALQNGTSLPVTLEDGIEAGLLAEAAYEALITGKTVSLNSFRSRFNL